MLKPFIILLASVTAAFPALARHATDAERKAVAEQCLGAPVVAAAPESRSDSRPYTFYRGTDGLGFVIVANDTRLPRIMGYSRTGHHNPDDMPVQLRALFTRLEEAVAQMPADAPDDASWNESPASRDGDGAEVILPTAEWGQDEPFNSLCPEVFGEKSVAGCGAVANAIVMRYHKYPEKGRSAVRYTSSANQTYTLDLDATTFDYDNMPLTVTDDTPQAQKDEIAKLIYASGIGLETNYNGIAGTTHIAGYEALPLTFLFGYSPECQYIFRSDLTDEELLSLTLSQIDEGLPVIYGGMPLDVPMGHDWVVDGYDATRTQVHCNFGWSGNLNGFYPLTSLMGRYYCDGIMINIKPQREPSVYTSDIKACDTHLNGKGVLTLSTADVEPGKEFYFFAHDLMTAAAAERPDDDRAYVGLGIVDADGKILEVLQQSPVYSIGYDGYSEPFSSFAMRGYVTSQLKEIKPSYTLSLLYKAPPSQGGEWSFIAGTMSKPTNLPVTGNEPMGGTKLRIDIGEDMTAEVWSEKKSDYINLPGGVSEMMRYDRFSIPMRFEPVRKKTGYGIIQDVNGRTRSSYLGLSLHVDAEVNEHNRNNLILNIYRTDTTEVTVRVRYVELGKPVTLQLSEPGHLRALVSPEKARLTPSLTISGKIDARDIYYIGEAFQTLETLDLSKAVICPVTVDAWGWYETLAGGIDLSQPANKIPRLGLTEMGCLKKVILPETLEVLGPHSLSRLNLSYDVKGTRHRGSLTLPRSVKRLESLAVNCNVDTIISLPLVPPEIMEDTFFNTSWRILCVPASSLDAYRSSRLWNRFREIIPLDDTVGIDSVAGDGSEADPEVTLYDLRGIRVATGRRSSITGLPRGLYIERDNATGRVAKRIIAE